MSLTRPESHDPSFLALGGFMVVKNAKRSLKIAPHKPARRSADIFRLATSPSGLDRSVLDFDPRHFTNKRFTHATVAPPKATTLGALSLTEGSQVKPLEACGIKVNFHRGRA